MCARGPSEKTYKNSFKQGAMEIDVGSTVGLRFVYGPGGIKTKTYDVTRTYTLAQKRSNFLLQNYVFL